MQGGGGERRRAMTFLASPEATLVNMLSQIGWKTSVKKNEFITEFDRFLRAQTNETKNQACI